jgi:TatD DNase family protein
MSGFADTHAHLHDRAFDDDRHDALRRARDGAIEFIVGVGTTVADSDAALRLATAQSSTQPEIYAVVGLHPHHATQWDDATRRRLTALAAHDRVVAVGEIGLDFFRNLSPPDIQRQAFIAQLELADAAELPVVIHSRDAHQATEEILASWAPTASCGDPVGVIHCFSGDARLAQRYATLGFMISFAGPVTYPKNDDLRDAACLLPSDRIVLETDCPYLAPQFRRGKRNEPAFVAETGRFVAETRGDPPDLFARQTTDNARRLFRLPTPATIGP